MQQILIYNDELMIRELDQLQSLFVTPGHNARTLTSELPLTHVFTLI